MNLITKIKANMKSVYTTFTLGILPAAQAIAAGNDGFQKANEGLNKWVIGLGSLAVATVTLCIMWIGYKVLFDGKQLHDMKNVIVGGILISGASGFGAWYMA
ncbi:TrbC/VirB2 family protein [Salmonella enterica]|nr:TrbC/VirB2 family protein [Salmonella enterica]EKN5804472.1 TrbC/VirB2 family protein [Salmonella enterica subsp. enterica]EHZ7774996.1 TrbC/VirB2 family protein [Salmonella enterica]ELB6473626.1 TrbC/VirB2 family protein [Salmonella enterica]ELI2369104.1 TrbC/VirB2 family protein [Salmonella enterica]